MMSAISVNGMTSRQAKNAGQSSENNDPSSLNQAASSKSQGDAATSTPNNGAHPESELVSLRQRVKELEEKEKVLEKNIRQRQAECDDQKSALRTIQDEFMVCLKSSFTEPLNSHYTCCLLAFVRC
jgi:predicted RNase H-like nuclease (RuvC/YqgF family)